ncbi:MAG: sigma-70 family RNA polymerase sigma factor [Ruminococcaceae bacterium]|nr:sigma-70 family RNA polymerase sigma factor [Oscillospiraceae bacterium]
MENTLCDRSCFNREAALDRMRQVMCNELTDWQREVLQAVYFEGKTQAELANEYGKNRSTICRTLRRAEDRLRRFLKY